MSHENLTVNLNIQVQPWITATTGLPRLTPRGELSKRLGRPKQRRFGVSIRPTTAALRKALRDKTLTREQRCLVYDWLLNRRHA